MRMYPIFISKNCNSSNINCSIFSLNYNQSYYEKYEHNERVIEVTLRVVGMSDTSNMGDWCR